MIEKESLATELAGMTPYHAAYFAYDLTKRAARDGVEWLTNALADAQVDLNPHQIDAALFAVRNPLSRGVILADEVGLGKDQLKTNAVQTFKTKGTAFRTL